MLDSTFLYFNLTNHIGDGRIESFLFYTNTITSTELKMTGSMLEAVEAALFGNAINSLDGLLLYNSKLKDMWFVDENLKILIDEIRSYIIDRYNPDNKYKLYPIGWVNSKALLVYRETVKVKDDKTS